MLYPEDNAHINQLMTEKALHMTHPKVAQLTLGEYKGKNDCTLAATTPQDLWCSLAQGKVVI